MTIKIATVAVYVRDQNEALRFWTEKIGLSVMHSHPIGLDVNWIELRHDGPGACLALFPRSMMQDWEQRKPSLVFECANVQQKYEELAAKGVVFTQPPKKLPWGMFAIFEDTEGNWHGLREKK